MQRTLATLALTLLALISLAQTSYKPGFVVTSAGDTLDGYLAYQDIQKNYTSCRFKNTRYGKETVYTPEQIKSFYYYGHHLFSSRKVPSLLGPSFVFVEHILDGPISILKYQKHYLLDSIGMVSLLPLYEKGQHHNTEILNKTLVYFQSLIKQCPDINFLLISNYKDLDFKKISTIYEYYYTCQGWSYKSYNQYSGFDVSLMVEATPFLGQVLTEQIVAVGHQEIKDILTSREIGLLASAGVLIKDPSIPINLEIGVGYFHHNFITEQYLSYPAFTFRNDDVSVSGYRHGLSVPITLKVELFRKKQNKLLWHTYLGIIPAITYSQRIQFIQDRYTQIKGEKIALYNYYIGDAEKKDLLGFKGGLICSPWPRQNIHFGFGLMHINDLFRKTNTVFKFSHLLFDLNLKYHLSS